MAPINPSAARNGNGHITNGTQPSINSSQPIILHLGDPILYSKDLYSRLESKYTIIRPDLSELQRPVFIQHLKDKTWGDFSAILRPFWNTGGEMKSWDRELIELLPRSMKVMASAGAGFDWVHTEVLGEHGILYTNGAGASTKSVADMALYHIISVFRQMRWSSMAAHSGQAKVFKEAHEKVMYTSHNPENRKLGIVGFGNIGFAIAKKVRVGLDMEILYHDIKRKPTAMETEVDATYYESLDEMLGELDCVLLASPGGPPILDARTLALMPSGSRVVNIARGSLIDENALADALESNHISAAGLDVHTDEPCPSPRLRERQDVTLTCHTGGGSVETVKGFEELVLTNVDNVLSGKEPLTAVNTQYLRPNTNGIHNHINGERHTNGEHTS